MRTPSTIHSAETQPAPATIQDFKRHHSATSASQGLRRRTLHHQRAVGDHDELILDTHVDIISAIMKTLFMCQAFVYRSGRLAVSSSGEVGGTSKSQYHSHPSCNWRPPSQKRCRSRGRHTGSILLYEGGAGWQCAKDQESSQEHCRSFQRLQNATSLRRIMKLRRVKPNGTTGRARAAWKSTNQHRQNTQRTQRPASAAHFRTATNGSIRDAKRILNVD